VPFPIVGIGASAGGLEAFELLFRGLVTPVDSAFVLVQHLEPSHASMLAGLVGRWTDIPVGEARDGTQVLPGHIYVIPPGQYLTLGGGKLYTLPRQPDERSLKSPIDVFFRSLAQDRGEWSAGIILSGAGTDGSSGMSAIHAAGGLTMVQEPSTAAYDSMPQSALQTGDVDYTLRATEMTDQLTAHFCGVPKKGFPGGPAASTHHTPYAKALMLLRDYTGHDFSGYKQNTVSRRVERRMIVHRIDSPQEYVVYLQSHPEEIERLHQELLIGVTSFFRDREAFEIIEQKVMPALMPTSRGADDTVRFWVVGCSSGEEVYSLSMLAQERLETCPHRLRLAFFATDIDQRALRRARDGEYPTTISHDVSGQRLANYFVEHNGRYKVKPSLREPIVFAEHSVIKDTPYSRLDFISCRNLLIYLQPEVQKKVIALFHYALKPGGYLFLGNSETVGDADGVFAIVDRNWKLYQRIGGSSPQATLALTSKQSKGPRSRMDKVAPKQTLKEIVERRLLSRHCPAAVVVDSRTEVLYVHGCITPFLKPLSGKTDLHLLSMTTQELKSPMMTAISQVRSGGVPVTTHGIPVQSFRVSLTVEPLLEGDLPATQRLLILIQEEPPAGASAADPEPEAESDTDSTPRLRLLEDQLFATQEFLRTNVEQLETTNEELQSTNEELQSANEELQSTNEELETSREESHSVNEELASLNSELQERIEESARMNNDLNNLLSSIEIAVIFLDNDLKVARYTPAAARIFHLIPADQGRPLSDLDSHLELDPKELRVEVETVFRTLTCFHREVNDREGAWYALSIRPYRTSDNVIEGCVLTLLDITSQKQVQQELSSKLLSLTNSPTAQGTSIP